jgi:hypothetical protein
MRACRAAESGNASRANTPSCVSLAASRSPLRDGVACRSELHVAAEVGPSHDASQAVEPPRARSVRARRRWLQSAQRPDHRVSGRHRRTHRGHRGTGNHAGQPASCAANSGSIAPGRSHHGGCRNLAAASDRGHRASGRHRRRGTNRRTRRHALQASSVCKGRGDATHAPHPLQRH